jgi:acetylornithine deacetylase/succinyl-diaminopimelate desuccinylase-like protein
MEVFLDRLPETVDALRAIKETIISNIVLIGQTPSLTFREKRRALLFMERLAESQVDEVTTDDYHNPIGIIRGTDETKPPIFVVAHLDTFFCRDIVHNYIVGEKTITGAGILDNSLGVGVLTSLPEIFKHLGLRFRSDIVLAGVIQSIGKGNLRGIRHLLKAWETPIRGAVCLEGVELGRLNYYSDGMIRGEIECNIPRTKGLIHKYRPNAILIINDVIKKILKIRTPQRPRTRIVIGTIRGGDDYGNIAYDATLGFEIRSDCDEMVRELYTEFQDVVTALGHENEVSLSLKTISNLNAARISFNHPLVKATASVMESLGLTPVSEPSESSLSIFLAHDIPAVTLGLTHGYNYFMEDATMEIEPMFTGIAQVIGTLKAIDSGVCDNE